MKKSYFYHPKFIPTWIFLWLLRLAAKLSFKTQIQLGKIIGKLLYLTLNRGRKITAINIKLCFPDKNKTQIKTLVKQHFEALGIVIFETANCFYLPDSILKQRYKISGTEHLQNALEQKQNIILLTSHFTAMLLACRMLSQHFKFASTYRPQNNLLFNQEMTKSFAKSGVVLIKNKDTKKTIKTLKSGLPVWYAPDQDLGEKNSVFAPFFNVQTATTTATARLAKITNSVVISYHYIRNKNGYDINLDQPIIDYPSADNNSDAAKTNAILQAQILKAPEQYLWIHKRFKTRPPGETSFYKDILKN